MRSGQSGKRGKDPFACEFEHVKRAGFSVSEGNGAEIVVPYGSAL